MLAIASRLRVASTRLALLKPAVVKTTVPALFTLVQNRNYATKDNKQVSFTVDKFPGYVRNENYKQVQ